MLSGLVKSEGLSLTPGTTYYSDDLGSLIETPTNGYVGYSLDTNILDANIKEKVLIVQPDWNQSDSSSEDYIKNKPSIVSKQSSGFVPQFLMNHQSLNSLDKMEIGLFLIIQHQVFKRLEKR